jgi:serine/threonine-protein kinase
MTDVTRILSAFEQGDAAAAERDESPPRAVDCPALGRRGGASEEGDGGSIIMTERTLFHEALARTPAERAAFLDQACAGQPELRAAVDALLTAHEASGVLDQAAIHLVQTVDSEPGTADPVSTGEYTPQLEAGTSGADTAPFATTTGNQPNIEPGGVIAGRYTLEQKIGEGGMGEVWVAKQTEPVKRQVALKLIKTGMDTKAVLARFEQERQALALMDHPNIARVLDGGMTPTG